MLPSDTMRDAWGNLEVYCWMFPRTHYDFHVYAIIVNNNRNINNIDEFDPIVTHSLTIISLNIYSTFTGI